LQLLLGDFYLIVLDLSLYIFLNEVFSRDFRFIEAFSDLITFFLNFSLAHTHHFLHVMASYLSSKTLHSLKNQLQLLTLFIVFFVKNAMFFHTLRNGLKVLDILLSKAICFFADLIALLVKLLNFWLLKDIVSQKLLIFFHFLKFTIPICT